MTRAHLKHLAPVLLGDITWAIVEREGWNSWEALKALVKSRWGLTVGEAQECFFQLTPISTEIFADFVLRVEDECQHLGIPEGKTSRHFLNLVPDSVWAQLK